MTLLCARLKRIAHLKCADRVEKDFFEPVILSFMYDYAAGSGAFLSGVEESSFSGESRGFHQIGILPHNQWVFAPHFKLDVHKTVAQLIIGVVFQPGNAAAAALNAACASSLPETG
jgi:hypothetical protein